MSYFAPPPLVMMLMTTMMMMMIFLPTNKVPKTIQSIVWCTKDNLCKGFEMIHIVLIDFYLTS